MNQTISALAELCRKAPVREKWLLCPSRRIGQQWLDQVAMCGTPVGHVRLHSVNSLAVTLAQPMMLEQDLSYLPDEAGPLVIATLWSAIADGDDAYLARLETGASLYRALYGSIRDLRLAGVGSDQVQEAGFQSRAKGRELGMLLELYGRKLAGLKRADHAQVLELAIKGLGEADIHFTGEVMILVPQGIRSGLSGRESELLDALAGRVGHEGVVPLAADPAVLVPDPAVPEATDSMNETSWNAEPRFFRAVGEVNEVREALRRAMGAAGRLDRIELLHTDTATYVPLVYETAARLTDDVPGWEQGMPVTFAEGIPASYTRPGRALQAWLEWIEQDFPQAILHRMLIDGLLELPDTRGQAPALEAADAMTASGGREAGEGVPAEDVSGGFAGLAGCLRSITISHGLDRYQAIRRECDATERRLADDSHYLDDSGELNESKRRDDDQRLRACRILWQMVEPLGALSRRAEGGANSLLESADAFLERFGRRGNTFDALALQRLRDQIVRLQHLVNELGIDSGQSHVVVAAWLESLADETRVGGSGPRPGHLHVAQALSGGHSGRPVTVIIGLDDGRFPGPTRQDPVLLDQERLALNGKDGRSGGLGLSHDALSERREAFGHLLGRLRGTVLFGFSCYDILDQREQSPSPLLLEAFRRHIGDAEADPQRLIDECGEAASFVPHDPSASLDENEWWVSSLVGERRVADPDALLKAHFPHLHRGGSADTARRSTAFTEYDGRIDDIEARLAPTHENGPAVSASRLETFGTCPLRYFFKHVLRIDPPPDITIDPDRWLDPLAYGRLLHEIFHRFMQEVVIERGERPQYAGHIERLGQILEMRVQAYRETVPPPSEQAFLAQRRRLERSVEVFLRAEDERCRTHQPSYLEVAIGRRRSADEVKTDIDRTDPVAVVLTDGQHLRVRAQVDRIDRHRGDGSFEICDYKTGHYMGKYDQSDPFDGGRCLQHILYLHVVRRVLSEHLRAPVTLDHFQYLFPTPEQGGRSVGFRAGELAHGLDHIAAMSEQIGKGAFIGTDKEQDCRFCDYQSICSAAWGDLKDAARCNRAKRQGEGGALLEPMDCWRPLRRSGGSSNRKTPEAGATTEADKGIDAKQLPWPAEHGAVPEPVPRNGDQPPPDEDERRQILEQIDVNMLVEAAAGTGKTTMMVGRMVRLVRCGRCTVEHMAAVTFTRKAAAELRDRFHRTLRHEARKATDPVERKRLLAALNSVDRCFVGTVHSFCASLLRERPVEASVGIGFEEIDEQAEARLRQQSWRIYVDELRTAEDSVLARLDELGLQASDLMPAYERICGYPDVEHWPLRYPDDAEAAAPTIDRVRIGSAWKAVCDFVENFRELSRQFPRDGGKLMQSMQQVVRMVDHLRRRETITLHEQMSVFAEWRAYNVDSSDHMSKTKWPGEKRNDKTALAAATCAKWNHLFIHEAEPMIRMWQQVRYEPVMKLLLGAAHAYARTRAEAGVLNYQDLLMTARDLLRDHVLVRHDFARRYTHILVDEFQDTDPIQAEVLFLLAGEVTTGEHGEHWSRLKLRPGSLFVVGDPKQSIYRFRRADIETYHLVKRLIEQDGGRVVPLRSNFRSAATIVEWVNQVFREMFAEAEGNRYGPKYQDSLVGKAEACDGQLRGVALLDVAGDSRSHDPTARTEAEMIARIIHAAVDQKVSVSRSVDEMMAGKPREVEFGDFMIISRQKKRLHLYARALERRGIPYEITGGRSLNEVRELALLHTCLRAVLNPDDETALVAAMRSELFGISDAALYAFQRTGGRFSYRHNPPLSQGEARSMGETAERSPMHDGALPPSHSTAIADAFARLRRYDQWFRRMPAVAVIEKIVSDLGLMVRAAMVCGGDMQAGSISRAIELLRAAERQHWTAADLVEYLARLIDPQAEGTTEQDGMAVRGHGRSVVRLMNLHKAKGLEAPVIFLADPGGEKEHEINLHIQRHGTRDDDGEGTGIVGYLPIFGPRRNFQPGPLLAKPAGWDDEGGPEAQERKFTEAETKRLLYVAATRAGSQLVISRRTDRNGQKHNPWQAFEPHLGAMPSMQVPGDTTASTVESLVLADTAPAGFVGQLHASRAATADPTYLTAAARRLGMEGVDPEEAVPGVGEPRARMGVAVLRPAAQEPDLVRGPEWGEVIHRLLEAAMQNPGTDLEALAADILAELDSEIRHRAAASEVVRRVMGSDVWQRARRSPQCYTEVPFCIREDSDGKPRLLRGAIDLVFREEDKWRIVDYKTDRIEGSPPDDLLRCHCGQVEMYRRAWSAINDIPLARIEGSIYFTRPGLLVKC